MIELTRGWRVLLTSTVGNAMGSSTMLFYSFGVLIAPIQKEFGWSRGAVSQAFLFVSAGLFMVGPLIGKMIDRYGVRPTTLLCVPLLSAFLLLISLTGPHREIFYGLFVLAGAAGAGTTAIAYGRAISTFFDSRRGMALGIMMAGPGVAAIMFPAALSWVTDGFGWRRSIMLLAALALIPVPLILFVFPREPKLPSRGAAAAAVRPRATLSRSQRLLYGLLTAAFVFGAAAIVAGAFHIVPMLLDAQWTSVSAARAAGMLGIGVVAGRLAIGWLLDRIAPILITQISFALGALGWAMLSVGWWMPVAALLVGLALGAESDILAFLMARYFGLERFGFLYASAYAVVGVASTLGPVAAGYARDRSGRYETAGVAAVAMLLIAIGILGIVSRLVSQRELLPLEQTEA